jgi:Ca2+-binding EF-hand superfamily protein
VLVKLFRDKIKSRGARGIIGLSKLFHIMDDDGSKTISEYEFLKACKDFKVGISDENVPMLFKEFDTNRDGTLNYDEFLMAIRGELNDLRRGIIEKAFRKIDKDGSGILDIDDIKDLYNAKKHPDVVQGKKTEQQILMEFLETFEIHHNIKTNGQNDSRITLDEFVEYYKNISASIDNDEYFTLMMNNSWNIKGDAATYQKYDKGWANKDEEPAEQKTMRQPP